MTAGLLALIVYRAKALALFTLMAFFIGEKLAELSRLNVAADRLHGLTKTLGRKLNRPTRSVSTRVYRGMVALLILEVPALAASIVLARPSPLGELLVALVMVALLGRGLATFTLVKRWRQAKAGTLMLDADNTLFADTHGVLRHTITASAEHFATRVIGGGFWFVIGGVPLLFAYLALAMAAAHTTPLREDNRAFGWAANRLYRLTDAAPRLLASTALLISGCFVPRMHPLKALQTLSHRSFSEGGWLRMMAELMGISLGGRMVSEAGEVELPWQGNGTAQLTATHLTGWLALLGVATLVWLLMLLFVAIL